MASLRRLIRRFSPPARGRAMHARRQSAVFALAAFAVLAACGQQGPQQGPQQGAPHRWSIVVHGGAGIIERADMSAEQEAQYRAAMNHVLQTGAAVLEHGGSSLDAVQ